MKYLVILAAILILATGLTACSGTPSATTLPTTTTAPTGIPQFRPIEVVGVTGPIPPMNPGGPTVRITLKNTGGEPVVQLKATLVLDKPFEFNFQINAPNFLLTGGSIYQEQTLLGPGSTIDSEATYSLKITATLKSGSVIEYTVQVKLGRYRRPTKNKTCTPRRKIQNR